MSRVLATLMFLSLPLTLGAVEDSCRFDEVTFSSEFEGARLSECRRLGDSAFELLIEPESVPINDSPWYAFRLEFGEGAPLRPLELHLRYGDGTHRYRPKVLLEGESDKAQWQGVAPGRLETGEAGRTSVFEVTPSSRSFMVSAQPLLTNADHRGFLRALARHEDASAEILGRSAEGRPIEAVRIGETAESGPWIVLLGRQHPPEVPGAHALQTFMRHLLEDTEMARRFRSAFRVLAVPNLNPDGVARGHWRLNANHVDLNRDWGPFTQPATRAVGAFIEALGTPRPEGGLWLLLDFHSTHRDVFYTQLEPPKLSLPSFTSCWLDGVDEALPEYDVARAPRHLAEGTTAKAWATRVLGAPAITYEVGDATDRAVVERVARTAARELMATLLSVQRQARGPCDSACLPCLIPQSLQQAGPE